MWVQRLTTRAWRQAVVVSRKPLNGRLMSTDNKLVKSGKTLMPKQTFNTSLETQHQRAFGQESYLEEVRDDVQTVTGWGIGQFKVNGSSIAGPIVLTKNLVFRWKLGQPNARVTDLTIEDFELFTVVKPALDLILLGTGGTLQYPPKELLKQLRAIAPVEIMDSVNAGATFNLLSKEDRQVAAALLPVQEWN
jgi:NADH dehydrogenase [ubiquinone] 1 alpha subcomplex assembly factor 3